MDQPRRDPRQRSEEPVPEERKTEETARRRVKEDLEETAREDLEEMTEETRELKHPRQPTRE